MAKKASKTKKDDVIVHEEFYTEDGTHNLEVFAVDEQHVSLNNK